MKASTADFLLNEDPVVESLQATIAKLDEGVSFATAFAGLVSYFAVLYQDKDLFRCLRASVQILVIYSITSGDHRWIKSSAARELGRIGTELGTFLVTPRSVNEAPLKDGSTPVDRFTQLTYLLDTVAKLTVLRAKIVHHLYTCQGTRLGLPGTIIYCIVGSGLFTRRKTKRKEKGIRNQTG